jgi:hypothetical protein
LAISPGQEAGWLIVSIGNSPATGSAALASQRDLEVSQWQLMSAVHERHEP